MPSADACQGRTVAKRGRFGDRRSGQQRLDVAAPGEQESGDVGLAG
jgi:hypothetical protein